MADSNGVIKEIGRIPTTDTEEIRVCVKEYRSKRALDIRTWYDKPNWKPGKGIWIPAEKVQMFLELLEGAPVSIMEALDG